jgi:predicted MFS family arabinose efflux permease
MHTDPESSTPRQGVDASRTLLLACALACSLAIAGITFAQPLLDVIADDFDLHRASAGSIFTITQLGYVAGLVFVVPLGDRMSRRRLILAQLGLSAIALGCAWAAPTQAVFLVAAAGVGAMAVVIQVLVTYCSTLSGPARSGATVGIVTSGVVAGLLLARTATGAAADFMGWRAVYGLAAVATAATALLLALVLPPDSEVKAAGSPRAIVGSLFRLYASEPLLRMRCWLGLCTFALYTTVQTSLVLALIAAPHQLSHSRIGLFGLSGFAGIAGALWAGRRVDSGDGRRVSGIALMAILTSFAPLALLDVSLWWLMSGLMTLDFGLQALHVTNQSLIFRLSDHARSRIAALYMLFYAVGCAAGAIASTITFATLGWGGVCLLGVTLAVAAVAVWCRFGR